MSWIGSHSLKLPLLRRRDKHPVLSATGPGSDNPSKSKSSWDAVEKGGGRGGGADYLYEVGKADYNTNVDTGA